MRKNGFTLMEILLALGIVGILASVLMKVLAGVAPDVGKAKFLKAYSTTRYVIAEMINDSTLYPDATGFANKEMPSIGLYKDAMYSGDKKFINIFADKLNATPNGDEFTSARDGVTYKISAATNGYVIKYYSGDIHLGTAEISNDGDVACNDTGLTKKYCETDDNPMYDLRQSKP